MKYKISILLGVLIILACRISPAQNYQAGATETKSAFEWPEGKKMALSLTFDDARLSQIDNGIPLFDKYGVKATFYVSFANMENRLEGWKKAAGNGHEIGNHSILHPCSGNFAFSRHKALEEYTLDRMVNELDSANKIIDGMIGTLPVSFAYPCGQKFVGRGIRVKSYVPIVAAMFESGRGWLNESHNDPVYCDLAQLEGIQLDGKSFDEIKTIIDKTKTQGGWLILAGHEMSDQGSQVSLLSTVEDICKYARDSANEIWIDNVHNIASYVNSKRGGNLPEE